MSQNQPTARTRRRQLQVEPTPEQRAAAQLHVAEGFVQVHRTAYGVEEESREVIRVPLFHTEPARVRVVAGTTRNLGDYNSARVEVMVEMPCYPEPTEIQRTYEFITGTIDQIFPQELEKAGVPVAPQET